MKLTSSKSRLSMLRKSEGESWALSVLASLFVLLHPAVSFAAGATLGTVICSAATNLLPYGNFISAVAYTAGVFLLAGGLAMLKQHADNPSQVPVSRIAMRLMGGAACMALPQVAAVVQTTIVGTISANGSIGCNPVAPASLSGAASGSTSLDVIFTNLFNNIADPMQGLLSVICLVVGVMLVAKGLLRAAKYGTDQKASLQGILANLIVGSILMAVGQLMDVIMSSLFGIETSGIVSFSGINWSTISGATTNEGLAKTDKVINSILVFVQVIGMISFIRGWLVVKTAAEGGQASMTVGATHIIGGVMCINITGMAKILNDTFGLSIVK